MDKRISLTLCLLLGDALLVRRQVQATTALSTTKAEYIAISEACKEVIWLSNLFDETFGDNSCTTIFCDSQSDMYLTKHQMFHVRTKHIEMRYHFIGGIIAQGDVKILKINTHDNPTNMMTKPVPTTKFEICSSLVGMTI